MRNAHHPPPGTTVTLKTGTSVFYVARLLTALHLEPMVIDTHEVRGKWRPSQKSDRRDALEKNRGFALREPPSGANRPNLRRGKGLVRRGNEGERSG